MTLNWTIGRNGQRASRYNGKQRTDYTVTSTSAGGDVCCQRAWIASWAIREATAALTATPFEHGVIADDCPSEAAAMAACELRANR